MLPVLIDLGFFKLPTYGMLLAIGIGLALFTAQRRARIVELPGDKVFDLALWVAIWGLVGGKLLLLVTEPSYLFSLDGLIGMLRAAGVFYGGLLASIVAAVVLFRRYKLPLLSTVDVLSPSVALGHAIGRLGCFAAGCCYGASCSLPWAVTFHDPLAREISGTPLGVPLHPSQLYEAAFNLANYAFLAWLFRRRPKAGTVFAAYLISYGVGRFLLEILRGDPDRGFLFGGALSTSQAIAAALVPLGVGLLLYLRRRTT
jgi:phosphatidylglycerol---prolipoprotein diacylglyceryl transferase